MSDALVSPPVFVAAATVSVTLLAVAIARVKRQHDDHIIPLMGVMGAFIFAAQMINFTIPGTGSSGHIVGGVLLAALLGPWAGYIALASVLILQSLLFADGGLMALGCNLFNMAAVTCLVVYPLLFRPLVRHNPSTGRIVLASLVACVVGLELGAFLVTMQTEVSGITALPTGRFLLFMLPIHLLIGVGEGFATAGVLSVVRRYKPELMIDIRNRQQAQPHRYKKALLAFAAVTVVLAGAFTWIASSRPDGLEWSIERLTGEADLAVEHRDAVHPVAEQIQQRTALIPDYDTSLAGIVGSGAILITAFGISMLLRVKQKRS